MRNILYMLCMLLLFSCNVEKNKKKIATTYKSSDSIVLVDTSKTVKEKEEIKTTHYGDSLKAALLFSDAVNDSNAVEEKDSVESAGIKVVGTLTKVKGGYKLKINATAKPTHTTDLKRTKETEQTGLAVNATTKTDSTSTTELLHKESRAGPAFYWWILLILFLLALALRICWKYIKKQFFINDHG